MAASSAHGKLRSAYSEDIFCLRFWLLSGLWWLQVLSHSYVTHWLESPGKIIFSSKGLFPIRTSMGNHSHPLQGLLYCEVGQHCTYNRQLSRATIATTKMSKTQKKQNGDICQKRWIEFVLSQRTLKHALLVWKWGSFVRLFIKISTQ